MNLRTAEEDDIPGIVDLLKLSLGEGLMPKSENYWRWKHVDNPFGRSPVLVASEAGMLVGVRAFMRWKWKGPGGVIQSVRAVDTATHPDFQGKGIFSRLTKALLEVTAKEQVSFVFNTPNKKSMPGYLKMGWETAGRLPLRMRILKPASIVTNLVRGEKKPLVEPDEQMDLERWINNPRLDELIQYTEIHERHIRTAYSISYLKWRYLQVPVAKYFAIGDDEKNLSALAIFRVKQSRFGKELRLCDVFVRSADSEKILNELIFETARKVGAEYLVTSRFTPFIENRLGTIDANVGPMVTVRQLSNTSLTDLIKFHNWRPAIGDLELF